MVQLPDKNIDYRQAIEKTREFLRTHHPRRIQKDHVRYSAVMILFLNKENIAHILFTRRTEWVETHKGQISFPGGMQDGQDPDLLHTARRETFEEVGILPDNIEPLGQLDDFYTVTNFVVSPFAGLIKSPFIYKINQREVAEVLEVPLGLFLTDAHFEVKKWDYKGQLYDVYFYYYQDQVIWGATAFILNRFIHQVFGFNPAPHPVNEDPRNIHYLDENRNRGSQV